MKNKEKGFTLVELIITIVIVAILSMVSVTTYEFYVETSKTAELYPIVNSIADAQELYYMENGHYTNNIVDLGIDIQGEQTRSVFYAFDVPPGAVTSIKTKNFAYATWERENGKGETYPGILIVRGWSEEEGYQIDLKVNTLSSPSYSSSKERFDCTGYGYNSGSTVKNIVFSRMIKKLCGKDISHILESGN